MNWWSPVVSENASTTACVTRCHGLGPSATPTTASNSSGDRTTAGGRGDAAVAARRGDVVARCDASDAARRSATTEDSSRARDMTLARAARRQSDTRRRTFSFSSVIIGRLRPKLCPATR
eukprot:31036-Pelagococcus_subviridis.AAC.4